jgi:IclR family acetate operon transcriptional repressor
MQGKVEGAMRLSGAMHRFEPDSIPRIAAEVKAAGEAASRKMGYHPEVSSLHRSAE